MPEPLTATPDYILAQTGDVSRLSKLQRVGVLGALFSGSLAALILIALLARWMWLNPGSPPSFAGMDETQASVALARYRDLQNLALESTGKMIDTIVVRILLPVFTSFVGFVFGSRVAN
jgi:hypothetical protein